jgi:hypothetical protein
VVLILRIAVFDLRAELLVGDDVRTERPRWFARVEVA